MSKPFLSILLIATLIAGASYYLGNQFVTNNYVNTKSPSTSKTLKYQQSYNSENISFEYPENFPIMKTGQFIKENDQGISLYPLDINNIDPSDWPPIITQESVKNYYTNLISGKSPGKSIFSLWNLKASDQIKKTKSGKFFRISSTFSVSEVCDISFISSLEIPLDNKIVLLNIVGNTDKIINSLSNSDYLKTYDGCDNKSFAEYGQERFWETLVNGNSTPEAKEWYATVNQVSDSLEF